jgi:uncharacterized membrane protein SirB2
MHGVWFWLHAGCAWLSLAGFLLRGFWMLTGSPLRQRRVVRIAPHLVDTVLLVSAVALMMATRQYPFADSWLTAKLCALLVYIALGMVAFRFGRTPAIRAGAFLGAVLAGGYILMVALSRSPLPL